MFQISVVKNGRLLSKAQYLRHRVFFGGRGKDADRFDRFCDHLVAVDRKSQKAVGTYRLLLGSTAKKNLGFYSESEFDLSNIKKNCNGELLEMGRACVDSAYRKYPVINLMWASLLDYFKEKEVSFVLGCASINTPTSDKVGAILKFFRNNCSGPEKFSVAPLKGKEYPCSDGAKLSDREIIKSIPSLVRGYLKMGAYVCGGPVWDKEFNTADFFMLLDIKKINKAYQQKFR